MKLQQSLMNLAKWAKHVILVVITISCFTVMPAMAKDPIRIGAVTSVTGPASYLGEPEKNALELMVKQVNQGGGVLGRQLELVHYDDASNPEQARTMMQRLLTQDRVRAVLGSSITPSSLAMQTLAVRHSVPQITMAGARILTDPVKKWLFSVTESDVMAAQVIYAYMEKKGITRIALLSSTAGYGRAARAIFVEQAAKNNAIEVVADETYAQGDSDMTAQLTRIRGNADVQAIINLDAGNQPAIVTRNHAALRIETPLYTSHSMAAPEFPSLAGKSSEGVRMNAPTMLVAEQLPEGSKARELGMAFRKLYQDRYGHMPNTFAGYGHDALLLLVDAVRRAGSDDPSAILDALEQTSGLVGVTSTLTFSPDNHGGAFEVSGMRMVEIRDGGFVLID